MSLLNNFDPRCANVVDLAGVAYWRGIRDCFHRCHHYAAAIVNCGLTGSQRLFLRYAGSAGDIPAVVMYYGVFIHLVLIL